MANPPELYLSLLPGYGDVSHISTESRHDNFGSRISDHSFGNRFMDLLDALAAICVHKEKGETFFVSLDMDSNSTTLHVSSDKTVPATVTNYLYRIRDQLKQLHDALEFDPSTTATSNEISPDPNNTQRRTEGELELQKTIYEHTYLKLRQRFLKRAPAILKEYPSIMDSLQHDITTDEATVLQLVQRFLQWMEKRLQFEKPPSGQDLVSLITGIAAMCADNRLKGGVGDVYINIVTRWDNLIQTKFNSAQNRILSLRRLLEKLFTLHHHIRTITRVAWCSRLSQFLKGEFQVVSVPADHRDDISINFSQQDVLPITFPPGNQTNLDVQSKVYDALMERLKAPMKDEGLVFKKGTVRQLVSMDVVNVHAECTLLAYHLRHPNNINSHRYFGGSKPSCHGCSTFFTSYNRVAKSLSLPQFFTRGCHNKVYLRWACPSLLSAEEQIHEGPTLDTRVRKEMVDMLGRELVQYVEELCEIVTAPSSSQSDSTDAPHSVLTLDEIINALTE